MKAFRLGLGCAVLALSFVGLVGCAEDNEASANLTGVAPGGPNGQGAPRTQADWMKQQQGLNSASNKNYPGANK
jgi:hypothetical protein